MQAEDLEKPTVVQDSAMSQTINEQVVLNTKNVPQLSSIQLTIEPWASITVDGDLIDSMAYKKSLELFPGEHQLILSHPAFSPKIIDIMVNAGEQKTVNFSFFNQAAFLAINVRPWAKVYIDGKFIEITPLNRVLVLTHGQHLLELKNPNYETFRQFIDLKQGDTLKVQHRLDGGIK